jgi:hypothetical protein
LLRGIEPRLGCGKETPPAVVINGAGNALDNRFQNVIAVGGGYVQHIDVLYFIQGCISVCDGYG